MSFEKLIREKKIITYLGSGGVGKTTIAAATALYAANQGRKTLVMTIDPAKRLADSLGIKVLGNEEVKIGENLYASMLDSKKTLDGLVLKHVSQDTKILQNKFYQGISEAIVGAQEYTAMGRLYEIYKANNYDLVVVDTAPTKHALNFIKTPNMIISVLDTTFVKLILTPATLLKKAYTYAFKKLEKSIGSKFLEELFNFMEVCNEETYADFKKRAQEMNQVLTNKEMSTFNIVCSPEKSSIKETLAACEELKNLGLPFDYFVVNKLHKDYGKQDVSSETQEKMIEEIQKIQEYKTCKKEQIMEVMKGMLTNYKLNLNVVKLETENLKTLELANPSIIKIPLFDQDVHNMKGLKEVAEHFRTQ